MPKKINLLFRGGKSGTLKFSRRHTGEMFEIFSERRLIAEIQLIGNLLHVFAREAQQILGLENNVVVNPFGCRTSRALLDD